MYLKCIMLQIRRFILTISCLCLNRSHSSLLAYSKSTFELVFQTLDRIKVGLLSLGKEFQICTALYCVIKRLLR